MLDKFEKCEAEFNGDRYQCAKCDASWSVGDPLPAACAAHMHALRAGLHALKASAHNAAAYSHSAPDAQLLERFEFVNACDENDEDAGLWVHIHAPEFTCVCPVTKQPDFAAIDVYYKPRAWCVESKSFKLYLGSFRHTGMFHERATALMLYDLRTLLDPVWCVVAGRFAPRGGIAFQPRASFGLVPYSLLYNLRA